MAVERSINDIGFRCTGHTRTNVALSPRVCEFSHFNALLRGTSYIPPYRLTPVLLDASKTFLASIVAEMSVVCVRGWYERMCLLKCTVDYTALRHKLHWKRHYVCQAFQLTREWNWSNRATPSIPPKGDWLRCLTGKGTLSRWALLQQMLQKMPTHCIRWAFTVSVDCARAWELAWPNDHELPMCHTLPGSPGAIFSLLTRGYIIIETLVIVREIARLPHVWHLRLVCKNLW